MLAEDGFLLRIRPPLGRLLPAQAQGLAELAREHGQARLSLTARANLQMRGVAPERYEALLEGLAGLGLLDENEALERVRNIVVTPFRHEDDGTLELARALVGALPEFPVLPGKFGFAIDTGARPVLGDVSADIRLERDADGRLLVRADGAACGEAVTAETAIARIRELARWFLETGGAPEGRGRMRAHLATRQPPGLNAAPSPAAPAPAAGWCEAGMLAAFSFGEMPVETLALLAESAPEIRLTPWRMVLLPGLDALPELPGVVLAADNPMLRVFACTGAPGCAQAFAPTRALAEGLAAYLPAGASLHVSGCGKGCAHPAPTDFTLIAGADGFTLNGTRTGLDPETLLRHPRRVFGTE
jgi:precorrin-3B synthase